MRPQFELVADCPACGVDGTLLEVYDPAEPACAFGLPAESRCRLCLGRWAARITEGPGTLGVSLRGTGRCPCCATALRDDDLADHGCAHCGSRARSDMVDAPTVLTTVEALTPRLRALAAEETHGDLAALLNATFDGMTVDVLADRIARGERTATGFDAYASLFQRGPRRGHTQTAGGRPRTRTLASAPLPGAVDAPRHDPRAMLLALVSILAADGQRDPREVAFVDRFLAAEGMAPLMPGEIRVHRPAEIAAKIPPPRRAEVVELMTQLACVDGQADPSEVRLVMSYASAWGIPEDDVKVWLARYRARYASDARRFLARLRSFFVVPEQPRDTLQGQVHR